jgi:WD40 repeat protein
MKLWNVETGECVRAFIGHTEYVSSVSISSDNKLVISGSGDRTLKLWNV